MRWTCSSGRCSFEAGARTSRTLESQAPATDPIRGGTTRRRTPLPSPRRTSHPTPARRRTTSTKSASSCTSRGHSKATRAYAEVRNVWGQGRSVASGARQGCSNPPASVHERRSPNIRASTQPSTPGDARLRSTSSQFKSTTSGTSPCGIRSRAGATQYAAGVARRCSVTNVPNSSRMKKRLTNPRRGE